MAKPPVCDTLNTHKYTNRAHSYLYLQFTVSDSADMLVSGLSEETGATAQACGEPKRSCCEGTMLTTASQSYLGNNIDIHIL